MRKPLLALLLASCTMATALANEPIRLAMVNPGGSANGALMEQIAIAEWSLRHSSVSRILPISVMDNSLAILSRARTEAAAGNLRTAEELLRRASRPLSEMDAAATRGKHPDATRHIQELRTTLVSIIDAGERVAAEERASADFVRAARLALEEADALLSRQQSEQARDLIENAYLYVQLAIADLRRGDAFYIPAPSTHTAADWEDGLRRIDERRMITGYLLLEARAEGIDVEPLQAGAREAEAAVAEGSRLAAERRWDQALERLDNAYARYEDSWRSVGIEW